MANLPPPDSLDAMARWMQSIQADVDALKRGSALSGQVSVGSLRIGPLLITADVDAYGNPMLLLRTSASGGQTAEIARLVPGEPEPA